jgi:CheY-like chemotaxis protein
MEETPLDMRAHDAGLPLCPHAQVLVVEDDADIRRSFVDLLEGEGYGVNTAENGADALAMLTRITRPCVILLDLMMPVMNGWQFLHARDGDAALAHIPVIIVSAMAQRMPETVEAVIPKPVDVDSLLGAIERCC